MTRVQPLLSFTKFENNRIKDREVLIVSWTEILEILVPQAGCLDWADMYASFTSISRLKMMTIDADLVRIMQVMKILI